MRTYSFGCWHRSYWKSHPEISQSCARGSTAVYFKAFQVNSTNNQWKRQSQWDRYLPLAAASSMCAHRWWPLWRRSQRRKTKETKSSSNRRHPQFKSHENNFNRQLLEAWITFLLWFDSGCTQKASGGSIKRNMNISTKIRVMTLLLPFLKNAVPDSKSCDTTDNWKPQ